MDNRTIPAAVKRHWDASDAGDLDVEHEIYHEDAVLDYPQSGERIRGRRNIQESRLMQPNKKRFTVRRMIGEERRPLQSRLGNGPHINAFNNA
jgi:hypothetical protein